MSTPLPGQIRCPTCHRSTPPAAFCTQCGTAIPDSARARPRGLDREELQDRIRTHRPGDAPFRRGSQVGGEPGSSTFRPYQPEPEDELVLSGGGDEASAPRVDNAPPDVDEPPPVFSSPPPMAPPPAVVPPLVTPAPAAPPPVASPPPATPFAADEPPPREPQPAPWKPAPASPPVEPFEAPPPRWTAADESYPAAVPGDVDEAYGDQGDDWDRRGSGRRSGLGPLAIGGFVLLGVLAIGVGAFMAGLFSGGAAVASPTPTPLTSSGPTSSVAASVLPSSGPSAPTSVAPSAAGSPILDGFTATTQPCAEQPASQDGCASSGATLSTGSVWVWVGWRKGSDADTLGVHIIDSTGADVGTGSLALSTIGANGCGASCNGWARFKFGGLDPGDYTIRVDRNGVQVASATFTVNQA